MGKARHNKIFDAEVIDERFLSFITYCTEFIREHGIQEKGIFRVGGNMSIVNSMVLTVEKEAHKKKYDFAHLNFQKDQISEVASLLKMLFRRMKEPLLTFDLYEHFLSAHFVEEELEKRLVILKTLKSLPPVRREALFLLTQLLQEISRNQQVNLMNSQNLSVVIAPNLLRPRHEDPKTIISDARATFDVLDLLINHHDYFKEHVNKDDAEDKRLEKSMARASKMRSRSILIINDLAKEMNIDVKMLDVISEKIRSGTIYPQTFTRIRYSDKVKRPVSWTEAKPQQQMHTWKTLRPRDANLVLKNVREDVEIQAAPETVEGTPVKEEEKDWTVFQKNFLQRMYKLTVRSKRTRSDHRKSDSNEDMEYHAPFDESEKMATELTNVAELTDEPQVFVDSTEGELLTKSEISNILEGLDDLLLNVDSGT